MHGGNELNYHIDTDTSVLCRVQILRQDRRQFVQMENKPKKLVWICNKDTAILFNTGWLHRVTNDSNNTRIRFNIWS